MNPAEIRALAVSAAYKVESVIPGLPEGALDSSRVVSIIEMALWKVKDRERADTMKSPEKEDTQRKDVGEFSCEEEGSLRVVRGNWRGDDTGANEKVLFHFRSPRLSFNMSKEEVERLHRAMGEALLPEEKEERRMGKTCEQLTADLRAILATIEALQASDLAHQKVVAAQLQYLVSEKHRLEQEIVNWSDRLPKQTLEERLRG